MNKYLAAVAAILAVSLVIPTSVNAGASSSAPRKNVQVISASQQQGGKHNYPITEYSSSARRNPHH